MVAIRVFAGAVAVALIVGAHLFIQKTRLGRAMRATFQDTDMARLTGVDVDRIYMFTFGFGAALAGASGALLGAVFWVYPAMGDLAALKSFAVVIMGGLGNFLGAIVGGLLLGVAESLGAGYISSGYKDAIGFVLIILLLAVAPAGPLRQEGPAAVSRSGALLGGSAGAALLPGYCRSSAWTTTTSTC